MKIKINREGLLWIERKGVMKEQICPYCSSAMVRAKCGDWCPLFEEPFLDKGNKCMVLTICQNHFITPPADFVDERELCT